MCSVVFVEDLLTCVSRSTAFRRNLCRTLSRDKQHIFSEWEEWEEARNTRIVDCTPSVDFFQKGLFSL